MKLTENFTLEEFQRSAKATAHHIDNRIPDEYIANVKKLAELLQIVRYELGEPITVTSGYRCHKLNTLVNGAANSDHKYGAAADIHSIDNRKLFDTILRLINEHRIDTRQLIWEYGTKNCPAWVHVSVNHKKNSYKDNQVIYYF